MNPKSFGKYTVISPLGRGGMASVYEARDALLDRRVAIKVIHPHLAEDPGFTDRFRLEARLVAGLRHPNIVRLYDFDVLEGQPFMVMEYLDGGTLKDRLHDLRLHGQRMSLDLAAQLLRALASALDYAHEHKAIHRDIKPANILFTSQGEPVITDFGIAKLLHESLQISETGGVIGTPAYMSPEQVSGKSVDGRSDQYALAVVLYEIITGRVPFSGDTPTAILMQHLTEAPPEPRSLNPDLPYPVQDVILKALSKSPSERYASVLEFSQAFDAALQASPPATARSTENSPAPEAATIIDSGAESAMGTGLSQPAIPRDSTPPAAPGVPGISQSVTISDSIPGVVVSESPEMAVSGEEISPPRRKLRLNGYRSGIIAILAVLLVVGLIFLAPWLAGLLASPAPQAPAAAPGEFTIAVADFDGTQATRKVDIARRIFEQLDAELADQGDKVRVLRTNELYADENAAEAAGKELKVALLIWGWYDDAGVSPHIQVIQPVQTEAQASRVNVFFNSAKAAGPDSTGPQEIDLNDFFQYLRVPRLVPEFDFFIKSGPEQIAYLSEAVLGMAYQVQGDLESALSFYDKALANADVPGTGSDSSAAPGLDLVHFQRGMLLARLKRLNDAVSDLEKASELNPKLSEALYNLGVLYPEICTPSRKLEQAVAAAEKVVQLRPEDSSAQLLLASLYAQVGRYDQGRQAAQSALVIDPEDASGYLLLGDLLKASGDLAAAETAWNNGLSLLQRQSQSYPGADAARLVALGDAYLQVSRIEEAQNSYQEARSLSSQDPDVQRGLGNAALMAGQFTEAEKYYSEWVRLAPDDPAAYTSLGLAFLKQSKADQAVQALSQASSLSSCSTNSHLLLGSKYLEQGDYPRAELEFSLAVQIEPENTSALYLLGVSQLFQNKYVEAEAALEKGLALKPDLVEARRALAEAYGEQEVYEKALQEWQKVVDALPEDPTAWVSLGDSYEKLGDLDQALAAYEQALHLGEDANIHIYIGLVHLNQGKLDQALQDFREALEIDPQSALALRAFGDASLQKGSLEDSLQAYLKSLELNDSPQLRSQVASIYARQGKTGPAIEEAEKALQGDLQNLAILSQLAGLYAQTGELDKAVEQYHKMLELDPGRPDAHAGLGQVAYKRCDLATMSREYESAARLGAGQVYYQILPALAYGAQGRSELQAQGYFTLMQDFPGDPLAYLFNAEYALQAKDAGRAESELQAVAGSGQTPPFLLSLAHADLGSLRYAAGDLAGAEQEFRLALQASPANAAVQVALGDVAMRQDKPDAALQAYELALSVLPEYAYNFSADNAALLQPALQARRALAFMRLNRPTESDEAFQQADALVQAILERTPQWPQARLASAGVSYLMGEEALADMELAKALACDASLQTTVERLKSDLALLR